jgi:fibronectin-binding autotransporter adhesin
MKTLTNLVPVLPVRALVLKTARVIMAVALVFAAAATVRGDTLHWDGSSSAYWGTAANWAENQVPADGDTLVFPSGALRSQTTNNIGGLILDSIQIDWAGYSLGGNSVGLSGMLWISRNALIVANVYLDLTLNDSASIYTYSFNNNLHVYGSIALGGHVLNVGGYGRVLLYGVVSGSGSVTKYGNGEVTLLGSSGNTYSGSTTVEEGTLVLDKSSGNSVPHALIIGGNSTGDPTATVRQDASFQIGTDVTINRMGTYDMNGNLETILDLNLNGGADFDSGTSTLTVAGDVTVDGGISSISGTLSLYSGDRHFDIHFWPIIFPQANCYLYADVTGTGNIIMTGGGIMRMSGDNSYSGTTLVEDGSIQIESDTALGTTAGGTTVNAGSSLYLATSASSIHVGNEALALGGSIRSYGNSNSWTGDIVLSNNASLSVQGNYLHLPGVLSGSGGFTKYGDGTLILSGSTANSYAGDTYVDNGTLLLNKSGYNAVPHGSLTIGTGAGAADEVIVLEEVNYQIGDSVAVTIHEDGWLNVDSYSDTVGPITFNGGHAGSSTGSLRLGGTVTVNSSSSEALLDGNVYMGAGTRAFSVAEGPVGYELRVTAVLSGNGLLKAGEGLMALVAANTFTGTALVSQGRLYALNNNAFGTTAGGTVVGASGFIQLVNANIGAEPLALGRTDSGTVLFATGSCSWSGDVVLDEDSTMGSGGSMEFSGAISGSGGITWNGSGNLILSGSAANTYTGETYVNGGMLVLNKPIYNVTVPGNLHIGDGLGGADADVVRLLTTSQIPSTSRITIAGSGLFDMNDLTEYFGSLAGSGHVNMGSGNLGCGEDGTSTTFSGQIEGAGELRKYGTGTFTLSGNNIYSGTTRVYEGTLLVNGSQPGSGVVVSAPGTLGGIGTVGAINSSGSVAPGASAGQLGSGSTSLQSGSSFDVELDGDSPIDYDQLDVGGSVSLGNSDLNVSWGFVPTVGDEFTIIDNDGGDAVTGIFNGLAEGASFVAGNVTLKITYAGGTGNDVVLGVTDVEPTEDLRVTSIETAGTNVVLQWTGGVPLYVVERKTALTDATWIPVTAPMSGTQTNLPMDAPASFYRVKGGN